MHTRTIIILGGVWIFISVVFMLLRTTEEEMTVVPLKEKWEFVVPQQKVPNGLASLSSEHCGMCHKGHYEEWKTSTHAQAWNDMQFQSEIHKKTSPFFCINCHIPLQNQQEYIVDGYINGDLYNPHKVKNEQWDPELQKEGITCAACHVRDNAIVGPTGSLSAPHTTVKDPEFLSETLCLRCHNAVATITPELSCSFETGDEWTAGPYKSTKNCISCHMKEVERSWVDGYEKKKSHYHYFSGSGIPKHDSLQTTMLNGLEFYPGTLKSGYGLNDNLDYVFKVKNENAGHRVPTGNPERFVLVSFRVLDADGKIVKEEDNRIGEKWEWFPKARKISDNNIMPLEERSFNFNWTPSEKGKYTMIVEVTKHRMDAKTAEYNKLPKTYPLKVTAYTKSYSFTVR